MKTLLLLLFTATAAHAQYTIAWSTMDGGGGSGTTGGYTLHATLGQPDIAAGIAGNFTFTGGAAIIGK